MTVLNPLNRNRFPEIEIEIGSAYECLQMLYAVCDADKHGDYEVGYEWLAQIRSRLSPELKEAMERMTGHLQDCSTWYPLTGIVYDCEAPRDVPILISHIEKMEASELHLYLLGYYARPIRKSTTPEVILRAAEGDKDAQKQFLKVGKPGDASWQRAMRRLLALDAVTIKSTVLEVLHRWYEEVFREQEAQILPILQRDADAKCALKSSVAPGRFIELATNGFEYIPEPFTRAVVLVPSFVLRPYVCDVEHHNVTIFCYPVADESLVEDDAAPPQRLVRLYKALADERRLRMLKKLAAQAYSLQEMADEMGVAKTTLHHHFVILRSAGLVRLRTSDHRYRLRDEMLSDASDLLGAYLKWERSSE
jgi:DNA-binding transcriptional ArsR family regulator